MGDDSTDAMETALLSRSQSGDTAAFGELVTLHRDRVYMTAWQILRNEDDALDVTQEAFLRAWKALERFDAKARFSTWLHRIVANAAIDFLRRRQRWPQTELTDAEIRPDAASRTTPGSVGEPAGAGLDRAWMRGRIDEAMATLSTEHRTAIVLKEIEGMSYQEIADAMACSLGTVMSRLYYARRNLQTKLQDLYEEL